MGNKIDNLSIIKKHFGTLEITKEVLNGSVIYEATPPITYPVKSDIITMNVDGTNRQFRVLKNVSGTIYEVLPLYLTTNKIRYGYTNNTYSESILDDYCNTTFYNSLNETAKSAIVDKEFYQERWYIQSYSSSIATPYYNYKRVSTSNYDIWKNYSTYGSKITRHCYSLSIRTIIDYLEATTNMSIYTTTLTPSNIDLMFNNTLTTNGTSDTKIWLSDCGGSSSTTNVCTFVKSTTGLIYLTSNLPATASDTLRPLPLFQIDLSKISFTIEA